MTISFTCWFPFKFIDFTGLNLKCVTKKCDLRIDFCITAFRITLGANCYKLMFNLSVRVVL